MNERFKGVVRWFDEDKGFGFIDSDKYNDVFVHYKNIKMEGYRNLAEGDSVEFSVLEGDKGWLATLVQKVEGKPTRGVLVPVQVESAAEVLKSNFDAVEIERLAGLLVE